MSQNTTTEMFKLLSKSLIYRNVEAKLIGRTMATLSIISLLIAVGVSIITGQLDESSILLVYIGLVVMLGIFFGLILVTGWPLASLPFCMGVTRAETKTNGRELQRNAADH